MAQFLKIMAARGHAMMVEGRLDKSELAQYSRDSQSALASDLANCFVSSDVAQVWTELAKKDLEDVEMVAESEFKKVIEQRMKALSNETRRLCGLPPIGDAEEDIENERGIDLFTANDTDTSVNNDLPMGQLNIFDIELKVVDMSQYKSKRKSRHTPTVGQMVFNLRRLIDRGISFEVPL